MLTQIKSLEVLRFTMALVAFALIQCGGKKPEEASPAPTPPSPDTKAETAEFRAELLLVESPNVYKVRLSWNQAMRSPSEWRIEKRESTGEDDAPLSVPGPKRDCEDSGVRAGRTYVYQLFAVDFGVEQRKGSVRIPIPKDGKLPHLRTEAAPFDAVVVPEARPQAYAVKLSWDRLTPEPDFYLVRKTSIKDEVSTPLKIAGRSGVAGEGPKLEFWDRDLRPDENYNYELFAENHGSAMQLIRGRKVAVPRDMELSGNIPFPINPIKISGRLFLRAGTRLQFQDRNVSIQAGEIISDGAWIGSYREGEQPPPIQEKDGKPGSNGKNGGTIRLVARKLSGSLQVSVRGQDGGVGNSGGPGADGRQGRAGSDASIGLVPDPILVVNKKTVCVAEAQDGHAGEGGTDGGRGGTGGRGGNGGKVLWILNDKNASGSPEIEVRGGSAGSGGAGGAGGKGGLGGLPGTNPHPKYCKRSATVGLNANPGKVGEKGASGEAGANGSQCLKIDGVEMGDCAALESLASEKGT